MHNPKFNSSGCKDLTAYEAIKHVSKEQSDLEKKVHDLVKVLKFIVNCAGFELVCRIAIRDKNTGKEFR